MSHSADNTHRALGGRDRSAGIRMGKGVVNASRNGG